MTIYVSGPMRGHHRYNFDAFHDCANTLRAHGLSVHDPAQVDEELGFDPNLTLEEQGFDLYAAMRRDLAFIVSDECKGVVVLPGWETSQGARAEVLVAQEVGKPVSRWPHMDQVNWFANPVTTTVQQDSGPWAAERADILDRFTDELGRATGDGSRKRQAGDKPPWYHDDTHEGAIFSHLTKWKRGERTDPDSGAHPLVHAAWRCLAIACRESGNVPDVP